MWNRVHFNRGNIGHPLFTYQTFNRSNKAEWSETDKHEPENSSLFSIEMPPHYTGNEILIGCNRSSSFKLKNGFRFIFSSFIRSVSVISIFFLVRYFSIFTPFTTLFLLKPNRFAMLLMLSEFFDKITLSAFFWFFLSFYLCSFL